MKKIILILALLSLGVSKAQVVGGYLPLNSTKSATMGGLKVNGNETVTGTFSVGSTATITDSFFANTDIRLTQGVAFDASKSGRVYHSASQGLSFQGRTGSLTDMAFFTPSGTGLFKNPTGTTNMHLAESGSLSVGANTTPSACLHVFGNAKVSSTFSLGSANLTGGNTGTVAVLSDVPFIMPLFAAVIGGGSSPADGTSYYIGYSGGWSGTATNASVTVPYNCTLRQAEVHAFVNGTVGSAESVTLAIQGTTNYTITSTMTYSLGGENRVVSTGISQDFSAGDVIYLRQFSPTWATNPTQVAIGVLLTFTRKP